MHQRIIAVTIGVVVVVTLYLGFQLWVVAFQNQHNQDLIVGTELTSLQFRVDSAAIRRGYFVTNLTFENPASEALNLSKLEAAYYEVLYSYDSYSADSLIATGEINTTEKLVPGASVFPVQMVLNQYYGGNASLVSNTKWMIRYYPQAGLTTHEMIATVRGTQVQIQGPYQASGYDDAYTTASAYFLSIVDVWAIGLLIVAVTLLQKPRVHRSEPSVGKEKHNIMLGITYALQAFGFLVAPSYPAIINTFIPSVPPDPYYIPYGFHGAGGIIATTLVFVVFIMGAAFASVAAGFFVKARWSMSAGLGLSILFILAWLYGAVLVFQQSVTQGLIWQGWVWQNLMFGILLSSAAVGHGIVIYVLLRRPLHDEEFVKTQSV